MQNPITATSATLRITRACRVSAILLPTLLLAGCGSSSSSNADLEARLTAVEAKADKAEARSKEALTLAASGGSSSSGGFAEPEEMPEDAAAETDSFGDGLSSPNQMNAPPAPPPGQGGPFVPPMQGQ